MGALCLVPSCQKAALEHLKFKKSGKQQKGSIEPSSSTSTHPWTAQPAANEVPPAQSRDGTVSSRYFNAAPFHPGRVLVPSSSPPPLDSPHRDHRSLFDLASDDAIPGLAHTTDASHSQSSSAVDSLSAPSGFVSNKRPADAFSTHTSSTSGAGP